MSMSPSIQFLRRLHEVTMKESVTNEEVDHVIETYECLIAHLGATNDCEALRMCYKEALRRWIDTRNYRKYCNS